MSQPTTDHASEDTVVDRVFAERLAGRDDGGGNGSALSDAESEDLVRRLNALDFVDSVVGGVALPDKIADYRITSLLGRGGMGTVYGAFQESLEREVALKVLSPALSADPSMRRRFRIEARATASLHHQHIVPIYDFGEAQGLLWFAMEKVDGISLDRHIARARREQRPLFTPEEAARRFAGVAEALGHAHRRRILHRDVKPANLLVHADGTLALADFGLSRVLGEASVRSSGRGGFLGTLQYASPEQARSAPLTPASDLYSLGVTMFEAVTGELPFKATTPEAVLDALLNQEPRSVRSLRPDVPPDLAAIIEKLLQKEPGDRYVDGDALARDLRRFADGEPVHVRRMPLVVRVWRRVRRRPGLSAAIAAAALLGVTALYAVVARAADQRQARQAQYASLLEEAIRTVGSEPGPLGGPGDLLSVLTGTPSPPGSSPTVEEAFARARDFAPELASADELRAAYEAPGDVEAEAALRDGHGLRARRLLDERIQRIVRELMTSRPADQIRLYRLLVARAVACLTAAVGDPAKAIADLDMATMFRPGAYAPRLLATVTELLLARDPAPLLDDLEARVRTGPPGSAQFAVTLLLSAAGDVRPRDAQWMRFDLPAGRRRALLVAVQERLGFGAADVPGVRWSGLEGKLADLARLAAAGDGAARREARRCLAEEVDPRAPAQSWAWVFELLQHGDGADPGVVADDRKPRACLDLLALEPSRLSLLRAATSIAAAADLAENRGEPALAAEIRARLRLCLDPARAVPAVETWVDLAYDDPEAYFARFSCRVRHGALLEARDDATIAVQLAPRQAAMVQRVLEKLRTAVADETPPGAASWSRVVAQFEPFL